MRRLAKDLIEKSRSAFILAIELYNKPTIQYRNESFCMLFTNAWELLLKAKIYEDAKGSKLSIFRKKRPNERRESITFDECVKRVFPNEKEAIRNNLQFISELRNESTHLIISDFNPIYSRVFQAGVLNYLMKAEEWFSLEARSILPPGFLALISAEEFPNMTKLKEKYSTEDFSALLEWEKRFSKLQTLGEQAAIAVQYKLALVKNPKKADVILSPGDEGLPLSIVERTRDVDETHPHRAGDVVGAVNKLLTGSIKINSYDLQAYLHFNKLKDNNNDYHWKTKFNVDQYSNALISEIFQAIEQDASLPSKWRRQYSSHLKQLSNKK